MSNRFELLAPGGDIDSIKAAIAAGADAVYCGLDKFNARHRADNLDFEALNGVIRVAHQHGCKIFLTLNIIILQTEFAQMWKLLNQLQNSDVDGVILQDIGLFGLVKRHFPSLDVHASTQSNTHNRGQIEFLNQLGASRVNLSRELSINEIKPLARFGAERGVQMEVFVHGSYCIGFSGLCYMSSEHNGSSGNRGRCSQPCRDPYQTTAVGSEFPLNMKDNNAFGDMAALADAGVYSLKVEGRIKKSHYVYSVVDQWRQQIDNYCTQQPLAQHSDLLYTVFNRDFTAGFLHGDINQSMYSSNPRDNSAYHFAERANANTEAEFKQIKRALYDVKSDIINHVNDAIEPLDISKLPLTLSCSGQHGEPLTITLIRGRGAAAQVWRLHSSTPLQSAETRQLDAETLTPIFKHLNDANHQLQPLQLLSLGPQLLLPFAELTAMREQLLGYLRGGKPLLPEVMLPPAPVKQARTETPRLAVLINRQPSAALLQQPVELYYQLPEALDRQLDSMVELFTKQPSLMPWIPAILLGKHFDATKRFLELVRPSKLVTNNSGVVKIAQQLGINWVAGPQFNLTNSHALAVLQQQFGCSGGFLSNELSRRQLYPIAAPAGMDLYYSIYHPQALMTSRMCFLQQTVGCHKSRFTESCLRKCDKSASLVSFKNSSFVIDKQRGDHNVIYANNNFLNLDAMADLQQLTHGFIDLRQIGTGTRVDGDNSSLVKQFLALMAAEEGAVESLQQSISGSSAKQYQKGL